MSYCTLAQVKAYKTIETDTDDELLTALIARATARIDRHCHRTFAAALGTHYLDAVADVEGRTLYLDDDFLTVEEVENGDGTILISTDYVLLPPNLTPKYAVKLLASSGKAWTFVTDPEQAIRVQGSIGYSATPPEDIVQAAVRLSRWYYDQRDAPFETTGMPETGVMTVPTALPVDIRDILDDGGYVRQAVR